MDNHQLKDLTKLIRYHILTSTTEAGSGHPTSSLSATDLMTVLFFGGFFRYFIDNPRYPANDRLIFSKGHASPLFYALWAVAGGIEPQKLKTLRQFGSSLEGHPTTTFPFCEAATGSLGQGLSIGAGFALNAKYLDRFPYRTFVLLGDGEMAEGSVWEAASFAAYHKLDNLTAIIDVNRLGQSGETMYGWNIKSYQDKLEAFGWDTIVINGHNFAEIKTAFKQCLSTKNKPTAIVAKTIKGKGVSFLENKEGWHGKALKIDELKQALKELGKVDLSLRRALTKPGKFPISNFQFPNKSPISNNQYPKDKLVATRKAYGNALVNIFPQYPNMVVLDAEVKNSTYAEIFGKAYPQRFFEMFIAEQNMVGVAVGLARTGKIPFVSSFAAFLTRAFDQIRMSQYSNTNIKLIGSHAGVSIGQDGPSQMGLEDLAIFSSILESVVLYPLDAIATGKLVEEAAKHEGMVYIRTTRKETPIIYGVNENFPIGGSKTVRQSKDDIATIIACGITLFEALKAYEELKKENLFVRVIDAYSIKPIDKKTLLKANNETRALITVEDHYPRGGLGSAVCQALAEVKNKKPLHILSVNKIPKSGKPEELLRFEEIDAQAIIKKVKETIH